MAYKQKHQYGYRDSLEKGDPEKVIYGSHFDDEFKAIEEAIADIDPNADGGVDIDEIDGLQDALDNKADKDHTHDEYLTDAPNDGKQYVRESEAWAEVVIPDDTGIPEPNADATPYARQVEGGQTVGAWVEAATPEDIEYLDGRIDAIEGNISGGGGFVEAPDDGSDYARNGKSPAWVKTYNASYIDDLETDYKNADSGKADKDHNHAISDVTGLQTALDGKADTGHDHDGDYAPAGHNHDSDYAPIDHTHTTDEITGLDDKIAEIEGDITDLEGAVGSIAGQLAMGGSYDASTGLVVTANLSDFTAGQPLPDYSTVPNTFVIVVEAGNNPEELGEGDWLVAGQSGWVAIKYGTAGSVDWDNISNVPDFDLVYAPIDHTHEIADVDGLQDALDAATGESLWTQNGDDIYFDGGNVGIGVSNPNRVLQTDGSQVDFSKGGKKVEINPNNGNANTESLISVDSGMALSFSQSGLGETMRIDADGNVLVGRNDAAGAVTSIGGESITMTFNNGIQINNGPSNATQYNSDGLHSTGAYMLYTGGRSSPSMSIDASGNVGIGTSDPWFLKQNRTTLRVQGAEESVFVLNTASDGNAGFYMSALNDGSVEFNQQSSGSLAFRTDNAERMVIDANGDATFSGNIYGKEITISGGSIWRNVSGTGGIAFSSDNGPEITPLGNDGAQTDAQMNFGRSAYRFKDGHFSGTVTAQKFVGDGSGLTNLPSSGAGGGYTAGNGINIDNGASSISMSGSYSGTFSATDVVATSDERLKDNISPMPIGLIDDIKPVQWTWKDSGKKSAGVIAQQLQEIGLDDFITEGEDGMLGVNYNALVSVLLAEVISLKKELAK